MGNTVKPLTPSEAVAGKEYQIHPGMIEAVNSILVEKYTAGRCNIPQKDILERFLAAYPDVTAKEVFDKHWMDIENVYEKYGWKVVYDKPGYNESGEPVFRFTPKSRKD